MEVIAGDGVRPVKWFRLAIVFPLAGRDVGNVALRDLVELARYDGRVSHDHPPARRRVDSACLECAGSKS
jgi:hypothetical protein